MLLANKLSLAYKTLAEVRGLVSVEEGLLVLLGLRDHCAELDLELAEVPHFMEAEGAHFRGRSQGSLRLS